ncbi:MAG: hypothetical protein JSU90_08540 [Nitrospiraceae bacterium]|nr:MAG: hypothetical protein JSU90_08540 [Nitrospiraceae bacterium]
MSSQGDNTIRSSIVAAFLILIMHVALLGSIGALVLFFYGIVNHMAWILLGMACLAAAGYWFYRRIKADSQAFRNFAGSSLQGKTVEVSFMGGLANFRISDSQARPGIGHDMSMKIDKLPSPGAENVKSLAELARLFEKDLISVEEFQKAKGRILD